MLTKIKKYNKNKLLTCHVFCLDWSFSADGKKFENMEFIKILQNLIDLAIYKVEWKITDISRKNNV